MAVGTLVLVAAACGGPRPCPDSLACTEGQVCHPDGRCRAPALLPPPFTRRAALWPEAWGSHAQDATLALPPDRLVLGGPGDAVTRLAFALPEATAPLSSATLHLVVHPTDATSLRRTRMRAHRARPSTGDERSSHGALRRLGETLVERVLWVGAGRRILLDVTPAVADSLGAGARRLTVLLTAETPPGAGPVHLVAPASEEPRARPRIDLVFR